jgi:uncharacterized protein DUF5615
MIALYMDCHVHGAIARQLRARGLNVLTVQEDNRRAADDDKLLERARELNRLIFTLDEDFLILARDWQRKARSFAGIAFGTRQLSIGRYVDDLELIANVIDLPELESTVIFLPF